MKLNLFKSNTSEVVAVKTTTQLIEEIHENFYTEVDKLLAEAKISHSLDTNKQSLIDKCTRLKNLGFDKAKEVIEAEIEIKRLQGLKVANENKKDVIEAIEYFSVKYPQYKFIAEDSVKKICEKYGLVYGEIGGYKGVVPDKNLNHIEEFSIDSDDQCFSHETYWLSFNGRKRIPNPTYINKSTYDAYKSKEDLHINLMFGCVDENKTCPLEIAAPPSDFDMTGIEVENFKLSKIEIPDPVVLKPVIFNNKKHYLIVTAWGEEASDNMVVNEKLN